MDASQAYDSSSVFSENGFTYPLNETGPASMPTPVA